MTDIIRDTLSVPLTVIVAVLVVASLLVAAVTVITPSLLPEAGDIVIQLTSLLTVQLILDVIVNVFTSRSAVKLSKECETVSEGAIIPSLIVPKVPQTEFD